MQRTYSLFCKIVIFKAPNFSNLWFFSSISFKCQLWKKFCTSNEGGVRFWKKNIFWKLDLKGTMFLAVFELYSKKTKKSLTLNIFIMWSQISKRNGLMCPTGGFKKKCAFKYLRFMCFLLFFKLISCTNTAILLKIWEHVFK